MFNRVLGNHPHVLALNELHFIGRRWEIAQPVTWTRQQALQEGAELLAIARRSIWDSTPTDAERTEIARLVDQLPGKVVSPVEVLEAVVNHLLSESGKRLATDQTPRNILYVNDILRVFPNAKVIQMVRDPRAVLYSQKNRWKQRWLGATGTPLWNALRVFLNYHPYTTSRLWRAAYRQGRRVQGHPNFMAVKFEDLVREPERVIREVCDFLAIGFDERMLDVPRVGSSNMEHRSDVRGLAAEVSDAWRGQLQNTEIWICERVTAGEMAEAGYEACGLRAPWLGLCLQAVLFGVHALGVIILNPRLAAKVAKALKWRAD